MSLLYVKPPVQSKSQRPATRSATNRVATRVDDGMNLLGRYLVLKEISRGGSARVFLAESPEGKKVAIKVLMRRTANDQDRLLRFYNEARNLMQLKHPSLVRALEVNESDGHHYMVMEYVDGECLAKHIMQRGRFDETQALRTVMSVAQGLHAAHTKNIIHRDVSPKNLILQDNGSVKLGDFEFSKDAEADLDLTMQGTGLGTPDFMSPEQFQDAKNVDARSDVYSLGATLYVMVTGRLPFPGESIVEKWMAKAKNHYLPPETFNEQLTPDTINLIQRSMDPEPSRRPQSAQEFYELAKRCLNNMTSETLRPSRPESDETKWTAVYFSANGEANRISATTQEIADLIRQGEIEADARVAVVGTGTFRSPAQIPQFQKLFRNRWLRSAMRRCNVSIKRMFTYVLIWLGNQLTRAGNSLDAAVSAPQKNSNA